MQRRPSALTAIAAATACLPLLALPPIRAAERLSCWMNASHQSCVITPWGKGGFEISFSGSAIFRFLPDGPPTTVTASKDDAPAAVQAAIHNVAGLGSSSIGGGLIQTTSG